MVPFYGQGMNCGFEDVQQLFMHMKANNAVSSALEKYTLVRRQDLFAISDLAMANYVEMRSSVTSKMYLARKHTEEFLYKHFPGLGIRTLYNMVSFSSLPYHIALKRSIRQGKLFRGACFGIGLGVMGVAAYGVLRFKKVWHGWLWSS
jgi:kynurenine 3-monooxygenase